MLAETVEQWTKDWKQQGFEEGLEEGLEQNRRETVINAYHTGVPIETIAQIVKLKIDEIESILVEVRRN